MDESFFRDRYDADAANGAKQSWAEYSGWVKKFYDGARFPPVPGWRDREADILERVSAHERPEIQSQLEETAKLIAAEWAKDNSVRTVSTEDLRGWGTQFAEAAKDTNQLRKALEAVRAEIARRVRSPSK